MARVSLPADPAMFKRLDATTRLLTTPPKGIARSDYYEKLIPSVLGILDPKQPPNVTPVHGMHRRAAAFALMRMSECDGDAVRNALGSVIFGTFQTEAAGPDEINRALRLLASAVTLAPPSPNFIHFMVDSVVKSLLTLDTFLQQAPKVIINVEEQSHDVDTQKSEVSEVLHTWLRLGNIDEVWIRLREALDSIFGRVNGKWTLTAEGVAYTTE